jgi:hypothetical protein
MPQTARLRIQRVRSHGWKWLEALPRVDGVVLPRPLFGFSGTGELDPDDPELLDHLHRTVPPQGARLVTGCSTAAEAAMIRLWKREGFGKVEVVVPDAAMDMRVEPTLFDATILAAPQLGENPEEAVDRSVLDRANMLLAADAKRHVILAARERRMTTRRFGAVA